MPRLRHTVLVALRGYRQAVELPGKTRGEVADVDHLLDFAETFGLDLADLNRNESTEGALVGAQLFAKEPHEFSARGTRDKTPFEKSREWRLIPSPKRGELVRLLGEELRTNK